MNIIFAKKEEAEILGEKYMLLELDTFQIPGLEEPQTAWCVVDQNNVLLEEMFTADQFKDLHNNMMRNYRLKNWKYCEDAIEHLMTRWKGGLDSFYTEMIQRIKALKENPPPEGWSGILDRSSHPVSVRPD